MSSCASSSSIVGQRRRCCDLVGVVQQHAHVPDATDARVGAGRRLTGFEAGEAQDALLGLAGVPVVVHLLVRAAGHAHPPAAALVLVDQDDTVLGPFVDRTARARRQARRIEAVVADPREIVEDNPFDLFHLGPNDVVDAVHRWIVRGIGVGAAEVVVPVGPARDLDGLTGDLRDRDRGRLLFGGRRVEEVAVLEGERVVVVVELGQRRVVERLGDATTLGVQDQLEATLLVAVPATLVVVLVLPAGRIAGPRPGLDVVPPHVLRTVAVGPQVLAGDRTGVTADALVEVEQHAHLSANSHCPASL